MKSSVIKLSEIQETVHVRVRLNPERLTVIRGVYSTGGPNALAPIKVTRKSHQLEDGRHRLEIARELGWTELPVEWMAEKSVDELRMAALLANLGGPLPPTTADLELALEPLVRAGRSRRWIAARLSKHFPGDYIGRLVGHVVTRIRKQNVANALREVTRGSLSVPQAAKKFGLSTSDLRERLERKSTALDNDSLRQRATGLSRGNAQRARHLADLSQKAYMDGDQTLTEHLAVLESIFVEGARNLKTAHKGWVDRAKSLKNAGIEDPLPSGFPLLDTVETPEPVHP